MTNYIDIFDEEKHWIKPRDAINIPNKGKALYIYIYIYIYIYSTFLLTKDIVHKLMSDLDDKEVLLRISMFRIRSHQLGRCEK